GEAVQPPAEEKAAAPQNAKDPMELPKEILFDERSTFEYGYCVEFILQRMTAESYRRDFTVRGFTELLQAVGESIVVVENGMRVKVHVHTMKPSRVFRIAEKYGEFLTVKVENMQIQHNEHVKKQEEKKPEVIHKDFAIAAVANSDGMREIFKGLGADALPDGGQTMNTSSEDFLKAFSLLDAKTIVVLPNNKNIIPAAKQAAEMVNDKRVVVLPSRSFAEGYYALAMDVPGAPDHDYRIESMRSGIGRVTTLSVTRATRDYKRGNVTVKAGSFVSIVGHTVVAAEETLKDAVLAGFSAVPDMEDKENCFVFAGEGAFQSLPDGEEIGEDVTEWIAEAYPMIEVTVMEGRQPVYDWVFGLV
ncbi:MAG: hypothetical protein IK088_00260, partial [Lachnospiraceae bacterium]|nr:hypothetical protein [Lachnospiraceae bacterium]